MTCFVSVHFSMQQLDEADKGLPDASYISTEVQGLNTPRAFEVEHICMSVSRQADVNLKQMSEKRRP